MKNEELFDLLENVDQKYINEAICDELDDSAPIVVRPGRSRITPLKILAPVAACLAVAIGAGAVISHLNKPGQSDTEQSSSEQITADPGAYIQVNFEDKDLDREFDSNIIHLDFKADDLERSFLAECISIITNESDTIRQNETSWRVTKHASHWCNEWYDYYFAPQIDGHAVPGVGVRVFHKAWKYSSKYGETFDIVDHGGFGQDYEDIDLNNVMDDLPNSYKYYYRTDTIGSAKSESIRLIRLDGNTDEIVEETILEKLTDGDKTSYTHWGETIGEEEFVGTWNTFAFIPKFYTEFTNEEVEACREELMTSRHYPTAVSAWRDAEVDIDLDGKKELLISPQDNKYLKGVYVFARTSSGIKEVGSFDTENGYCKPEQIHFRNVSANNVFPYYFTMVRTVSSDSRINFCDFALNKILIDENGNITTEEFAVWGTRIVNQEMAITEDYYILNGEEVDQDEFHKEWNKYVTFDEDHEYYKPYVTTDPNNCAWD